VVALLLLTLLLLAVDRLQELLRIMPHPAILLLCC
jgi:hypothetical protein